MARGFRDSEEEPEQYASRRRKADDLVYFKDCTVITETEKALLVECAEWEGDMWIPKSQIHDDSEVYGGKDGTEGTLIISAWLAKQKGLV